MSNVVKEMLDQVSEAFPYQYIFLPADMAVAAMHQSAAIQAVLFFTFLSVTHRLIFLKNKYKLYKNCFFFVSKKLRLFLALYQNLF